MKIAYIVPSLSDSSGWRSHATGFIQAISTMVEPILFVSARDRATAQDLFQGHELHILPATQYAYLRYPGTAPRFFASWLTIVQGHFPTVEIVHSLDAYPTGIMGHWLSAKLHCPHVISALGTYGITASAFILDRIAYGRVLTSSAALCPISQGTANLIRTHFEEEISRTRLETILLGTNFHKFITREEALSRTPAQPPIILSVGAIKPRKGYHVSLKAFARLRQHIPSARYQIVGSIDEGQRAYYEQLLELGRQIGGVEFLGSISNAALRQCYMGASVFLLTPQHVGLAFEGFGLVYLEAGAYGLPVVGTRTGGVADAVLENETGFLKDSEDVEGLAQALVELLSNDSLARKMGYANRKWSEKLTWERCAEHHHNLYQAVISNNEVYSM